MRYRKTTSRRTAGRGSADRAGAAAASPPRRARGLLRGRRAALRACRTWAAIVSVARSSLRTSGACPHCPRARAQASLEIQDGLRDLPRQAGLERRAQRRPEVPAHAAPLRRRTRAAMEVLERGEGRGGRAGTQQARGLPAAEAPRGPGTTRGSTQLRHRNWPRIPPGHSRMVHTTPAPKDGNGDGRPTYPIPSMTLS